jgi:hypothetical protein
MEERGWEEEGNRIGFGLEETALGPKVEWLNCRNHSH